MMSERARRARAMVTSSFSLRPHRQAVLPRQPAHRVLDEDVVGLLVARLEHVLHELARVGGLVGLDGVAQLRFELVPAQDVVGHQLVVQRPAGAARREHRHGLRGRGTLAGHVLGVEDGAFDLGVAVLDRSQLAHGLEVAAARGGQQPVGAQPIRQIGIAIAVDELLQLGVGTPARGRAPQLIAQQPVLRIHAERIGLGLGHQGAQDRPLLAIHGFARGHHGGQRGRFGGGRQARQHGRRHGDGRLRRLRGGLRLGIDGCGALLGVDGRARRREQRQQGQPAAQAGAGVGGARGFHGGFLIPSGLRAVDRGHGIARGLHARTLRAACGSAQ